MTVFVVTPPLIMHTDTLKSVSLFHFPPRLFYLKPSAIRVPTKSSVLISHLHNDIEQVVNFWDFQTWLSKIS